MVGCGQGEEASLWVPVVVKEVPLGGRELSEMHAG